MQTHVSEEELLAQYIDEVTGEIIYPSSDGQPMAETTEHFEHITTIEGNLDSLFADKTDVFVAGDLLWYPEKGKPYICNAPDTMVVFGRPKGHRSSYEQWNEDDIAPAVVFEILSKSNSASDMIDKFLFYEKYGVQEYYVYDHLRDKFYAWVREGNRLHSFLVMPTFKSPLLGVTFEIYQGSKLKMYNPDGSQFLTFVQNIKEKEALKKALKEQKEILEEEKARAEQEKARADEEKEKAEEEKARAEQEKARADEQEEKAEEEKARADEQEEKAEEEKARAEKAEAQIELLKKFLIEKGFSLSND
ncbi:MAG: Uma2 family endonuclease [Bacteroidetes bacterium]|nr:MAG: Uma2 family endonuclease [Bacteroidota bacterium]TAG89104.1 MAG: Uma2 family endonuclease [Bacteroidota bacterium]